MTGLMGMTLRVAIDRVTVPAQRLRALGDVCALAESIHESGLLNPIVVTPDYRLVAGLHRLEACKQLGWNEIEVRVLELDTLHAELAEIDENLIRAELTALERGEHLARRKVIYEELHPETKRGVAGGKARHSSATADSAVAEVAPTFTQDTSVKTGVSARVIREDVQIAQAIAPAVKDALRGTPLADKKTALLDIAKMDADDQRAIGETLTAPPASPLRQALAHSKIPVRTAADIMKNPELRESVESGQRTVQEAASVADLMRDQMRRSDEETGASLNHKMTRLLTSITDIAQDDWDAVHNSVFNRQTGSTFRSEWVAAARHMLRLAEGGDVFTIDAAPLMTLDAN